jgi:hypothetical protein
MKKEHRVCKSASHSKQSCRNSNFQRPPLPLKLCAFVRASDAGDGAWGGMTPEIGVGVGFVVYKLIIFLDLIFTGTS